MSRLAEAYIRGAREAGVLTTAKHFPGHGDTGTDSHIDLPVITVYKSPTCGCCSKWITHLEEEGFEVDRRDLMNVTPIKQNLSVPQRLSSCHTAVVDGYVVEGHVPADDIKRLLNERPDVTGLAVPGMPIGSPGMEVPGRGVDPYDVIAFGNGEKTVFAEHR